MPVRINGATSGSTTIAAPDTGGDETIVLSTALASKANTASPTFTGNVVWSGSTLRAGGAVVNSSQTTTSTSYADLATVGPSVTLTTGTKALVIVGGSRFNSNAAAASIIGVAVSGATTLAAADSSAVFHVGTTQIASSKAIYIDNLTAGTNTFTAKYRVTGNTGTFEFRQLFVIDLGS